MAGNSMKVKGRTGTALGEQRVAAGGKTYRRGTEQERLEGRDRVTKHLRDSGKM
jgi:hypothetical protein